jgi:alpha-beta hydrolase superfamily lysophospholipase
MVEKKHPLPEHIQVPWPERDTLKLRVVQDGEEIMLMTYRYPVDPSVRKGVIFHIHGFGSYCERYAFMAKMWAEAGYEVIAFD